jgi:hypothetical protein
MEMTPKEKAKELVDKFVDQPINFPYIDTGDGQCIGSGYMTHNSAKQCALIACRELKRQWIELNYIKGPAETNYWDSVKEEIKKL